MTVIHLSIWSRIKSPHCGVRRTRNHRRAARFPISSCIGLGLPCPFDCSFGGGLLPHLFTLTSQVRLFIFCGTGREPVLKQAPPAFEGNPALWCPDFPLHPRKAGQRMTVSRKWSERKYISFQNQKFSRPCLLKVSRQTVRSYLSI